MQPQHRRVPLLACPAVPSAELGDTAQATTRVPSSDLGGRVPTDVISNIICTRSPCSRRTLPGKPAVAPGEPPQFNRSTAVCHCWLVQQCLLPSLVTPPRLRLASLLRTSVARSQRP